MSKTTKTTEPAPEILPSPLVRTLRVDELKDGEECSIEINAAERAVIASLLDLVALDHLRFACDIQRRGQGRIALQGALTASVIQTCVVSLEPVASMLDVPVEVEFWPEHLIADRAGTIDEGTCHGVLDWPEPIIDNKIDLGPVIYETLATVLDPYPKRAGVSFEWSEESAESESKPKESPFAALKHLK